MSRKGMKTTLYSIIFLVTIFLAFFVSAGSYQYYQDPVVPTPGKLDVKDNLLVDSFTGAAIYKYPLDTPPGVNSLKPHLNLLYNSHSMKRAPDVLGSGWSISGNYVQINTNNTFGNLSDDSFTLVLDGVSYSLVNSTGRYYSQTENFFFINKTSGGQNIDGQYWIVRTTEGNYYRFGFYNFSEVLSNTYNYTWRWYLDLVNDTYNNTISYNYSKNPFPQDKGAVYLDKISYNNDHQRNINFFYDPNNTVDLRSIYEDGNLISMPGRLKDIYVNVSSNTVKRYSFSYARLETEGTVTSLSNITEYGEDNFLSINPTKFEYNPIGDSFSYLNLTFEGCSPTNNTGCFAGPNGEDLGVRLVDLNGDGLDDIVRAYGGATYAWLNNGTGWHYTNWSHGGCNPSYTPGCFAESGLDIGTRLVDLNGDGLVDVVRAVTAGGGYYISYWAFMNNGTGWADLSYEWYFASCHGGVGADSSGCFTEYPSGKDLGVRLIDINGDGLVDLLKARYTGSASEEKAWVSKGDGFYEVNLTFDGCNSVNSSGCFVGPNGEDLGVRPVDINGDGLVDIVRAYGAATYAWLNNGTGWHYTNWSHGGCNPSYTPGCFAESNLDSGARLADLNGDGLADVIRAVTGGYYTSYWIFMNNGTGWADLSYDFGYPACHGGVGADANGCFTDYPSGADRGVRLIDINGDGLLDSFRAQATSPPSTFSLINNGRSNYLIKNIKNSFGGETTINYKDSTSLDNTGDDNKPDLNFNLKLVANISEYNYISGPQSLTSIRYYNFSGGIYNITSKEFRGFNMAEEKIGDKITKHWFHQDQEKIGKEYKTEILDNLSNSYKTIENTWNSTDLGSYYLVLLTGDSETDYDGMGSDPKIINNTYSYDSFGNVVYKHSLGDVNDLNDDKFEIYSYVNNSDKWIVNKINNYTLFSSDNSTVLKNSIYFYDNSSFGASPTKGSLTKNEEMINVGAKQTKVYEYNNFGNKIKFTDSNGIVTKYGYGSRDTTNTFPDNMTNSKNQSAIYFYDLGSGNLLAQSDSNNFVKNYTYDALSIDKSTVLPFDTIGLPTQEYEYNFTSTNAGKIVIKQREQNNTSNTLDKYKFYDGFGRLIQTKTEAINGKQIAVDYYYDLSGRIKAQTNPYFVSASTDYSTPNTTVGRTNYTYDVLDRVIEVITQDGSIKNISYNRWNVSIIDENGNNATYTKDAYGRIVKVIEYNGIDKYITSYLYDSSNNLLSITDSLNNTLNYTYDSLGRKIKEKDLDRGTWNYTYDSEGNLIKQFDARNISTSWVYDSLNRKINETSLGGSILFFYDIGLNGTLSSAKINATIINYTYDGRLRKIAEKVNVTSQKSYSTNWTYDSSDRVTSQIMPDGRVINYTYDDQGLLSSISEVVGVNYNENSNPTSINYSNGLNTSYSYNSSNFRLVQINSPSKQNLNYQYDPIGNVLSIVDNVHSTNYSMAYDQLNRLSSTIITGDYNVVFGFIYDQIGNIRNVTGNYATDYYYQDSRPHATSKVVYY